MVARRLGKRRTHEEAVCEGPLAQLLAASEDPRSGAAQLRGVARVVVVAGTGRHWTQPVLTARRVTDAQRRHLSEELVDERVRDLTVHVQPRERRALLASHAERR